MLDFWNTALDIYLDKFYEVWRDGVCIAQLKYPDFCLRNGDTLVEYKLTRTIMVQEESIIDGKG